MSDETTSYRFRFCGVLLGIVFHVTMFAWALANDNPLAGGFRFLFVWYMPAIVLGLPWSIPAVVMDAFVPGLSILGLMAAVCFNGYLVGWPFDAIVNSRLREQQRKHRESCRAKLLSMMADSQTGVAEPVSVTNAIS